MYAVMGRVIWLNLNGLCMCHVWVSASMHGHPHPLKKSNSNVQTGTSVTNTIKQVLNASGTETVCGAKTVPEEFHPRFRPGSDIGFQVKWSVWAANPKKKSSATCWGIFPKILRKYFYGTSVLNICNGTNNFISWFDQSKSGHLHTSGPHCNIDSWSKIMFNSSRRVCNV